MSQREIDPNGWWYIKKNPISKSGVFPYLGSEIGAPESTRIYNVLRSPEELEKAAPTFRLLPIIDDHELLGSIGTSTDERVPAGSTGENVYYEHPYLYSSIKITSNALQEQIQRGKIELSPAYTCTWEQESGDYEGVPYDYKQVINHGNHLALVDKGRTGSDVAVLDSYVFDTAGGLSPMKNLDELLAAIGALSDEEKAQLLAALSPATDEEEDEDEIATDDEVTDIVEETDAVAEAAAEAVAAEEQGDDVAAVEAAVEAVENAEAVLEAAEELQEKIAQDAMHKAVKHIDARNAMAARVKPFIGAVPTAAMDSAETIAAYACKKFGVKHSKGQATAVITGYLHGRKPASAKTVAQDKATVSTHKPKASVFGWEK